MGNNAKTYDDHTAKFIASVVTCISGLSSDVMQGWVENPKALKKVLNEALSPVKTRPKDLLKINPVLNLLSAGEKIILEVNDGKSKIYGSDKIFKFGIDVAFEKFRKNQDNQATEETLVDVYEASKDAIFAEIFTSFNCDLDKLVMTQAQIVRFFEKYSSWLCFQEDGATFFLIKENDEYFVVIMYVYDNGTSVNISNFGDSYIWLAEHCYRVITPQIIS